MAILTTTTNYPLPGANDTRWTLVGPDGTGIGSSGNGEWNYRSTATGSTGTGPSIPPPGPDAYYWYCETSGTSLGEVFTMELVDTLDAGAYNYTVDFYYSNYGTGGGGECLVQYWNGASWDNVQTIGWSTSDSSWHAATQIDLSSYNNADGKFRYHFTTGGGTTYQNDFALDDITFTVEIASSSSSSVSSSSTSSSSSSVSSSSSSLSSSSFSSSSRSSSSSSTIQEPYWWGIPNVPYNSGGGINSAYTLIGVDDSQLAPLNPVPLSGYVTKIQLYVETAAARNMDFAAFTYQATNRFTDQRWIQNIPVGIGVPGGELVELNENVDYPAPFPVSAGEFLGVYNGSPHAIIKSGSSGGTAGQLYDSGDQIGDGTQSQFAVQTSNETQLRFYIEYGYSVSSSSTSSSSSSSSSSSVSSSSLSSSSTSFYPLWWGTSNEPVTGPGGTSAGYTLMGVDDLGSVPVSGYVTAIELFTNSSSNMDFAAFSYEETAIVPPAGWYTDTNWIQNVLVPNTGLNQLYENIDYLAPFPVSAGQFLGVYNGTARILSPYSGPAQVYDSGDHIGSGTQTLFSSDSNRDTQIRFLIERNFSVSSSSLSSSSTSSSSNSSSSSSVSSSSTSQEPYWWGTSSTPYNAPGTGAQGYTIIGFDAGGAVPKSGYVTQIQVYTTGASNMDFAAFDGPGTSGYYTDTTWIQSIPVTAGFNQLNENIDYPAPFAVSAGQWLGFYTNTTDVKSDFAPNSVYDYGDQIGDGSQSYFQSES